MSGQLPEMPNLFISKSILLVSYLFALVNATFAPPVLISDESAHHTIRCLGYHRGVIQTIPNWEGLKGVGILVRGIGSSVDLNSYLVVPWEEENSKSV